MAYNPFQWWTSHIKNKRLSSKAHLFDKIQNKDFDYSNYFNEAEVVRKRAAFTFENTMKETTKKKETKERKKPKKERKKERKQSKKERSQRKKPKKVRNE